jgi:hypothetical protein
MANRKRALLFHPDGKREFAPMIDGWRLSATLAAIPGRQLCVFTEGVGERNSAVDLMTSEFSVATSALHGRALQETSTRKDWEFFEPGEAEAPRKTNFVRAILQRPSDSPSNFPGKTTKS